MSEFINTIENFFNVLDWNLVIAGFGMIVIFALIVYLLGITVIAFQNRRDAVKVSLPDINTYGKDMSTQAQFTEVKDMGIELINPEEDRIDDVEPVDNEDLFLTALSIETGKYIPKDSESVEMPKVGEIDYEEIKRKNKEKADKQSKEDLARLKEIAKADGEGELIEEELIKKMNKSEGVL